jgi:heme/copper-type cytochrome/quinol oxidase subunit 2
MNFLIVTIVLLYIPLLMIQFYKRAQDFDYNDPKIGFYEKLKVMAIDLSIPALILIVLSIIIKTIYTIVSFII